MFLLTFPVFSYMMNIDLKVGYWIESGDGTKIDPLSTALSISEEDKKDPRVEKAIEEMLEEYVW